MDPLYPWYEVAHQIAKTNGWTETEELNLSTVINKSIQTGDLNCWLPDGRPLSFNDAGVPLAKQGKSIYELSNKQLQPMKLRVGPFNNTLARKAPKKLFLPKVLPTASIWSPSLLASASNLEMKFLFLPWSTIPTLCLGNFCANEKAVYCALFPFPKKENSI